MDQITPYMKIMHYFETENINYQEIEHNPVASAEDFQKELGTNLEEQAKALLLRYKNSGDKGFMVLALQAQKKANIAKLKSQIQVKTLKLAQISQLKEATGCDFGELPPLGTIFGLKLIMDEDLLSRSKIYFNAGRLDRTFVVDPKDIFKLENPILLKA